MRIHAVTREPLLTLDYSKYGSQQFPIRQSDLGKFCGAFACSKSWHYGLEEYNTGANLKSRRSPKTVRGIIIHEVLDHLHTEKDWWRMPWIYRRAWKKEEESKEEAPIEWGTQEERKKIIREGYEYLKGYVAIDSNVNARVVGEELSFVTKICDGQFWATGTIDQIRRVDGGYQIIDFKSGIIDSQDILNNSYQLAIYGLAALQGSFFYRDRPEETFQIREWPQSLALLKLNDLVPYKRPTAKTVSYVSEAEYFGVPNGTVIKPLTTRNPEGHPLLTKGARKGVGLYESRMTLEDATRIEGYVEKIVAVIRLGKFWEANSIACSKCSYKAVCRGAELESAHDLLEITEIRA